MKDKIAEQGSNQLFVLTELLSLQERVRPASLQELRFIAVNETHNLINYEQGVLWEIHAGTPIITALSGVSDPDKNAAYSVFLKRFYKKILSSLDGMQTLSIKDVKDPTLKAQWKKWLPSHILCAPINNGESSKIGLLLLARNNSWLENEKPLLSKIMSIYNYDFSIKRKRDRSYLSIFLGIRHSIFRYILLLLILTLLMYPFQTSVLAPAEIIAYKPDLIRAPIDGVINEILVEPNQLVTKDQVLVVFDQAAINAQIEVTENSLKVAQATLRQTTQEALGNMKARTHIAYLEGQVEKEKTNLSYYKELLGRSEIRAPKSGTVIFEDVFDWLGRPVVIGERIMLLAQETKTELEILLSVPESIPLNEQAEILFFSNARPDIPIRAQLYFHSYHANKTEQDEISYRLKGRWLDNEYAENRRLGLKGTAKIYGSRKPLIMNILRKPFVRIRQFFGI